MRTRGNTGRLGVQSNNALIHLLITTISNVLSKIVYTHIPVGYHGILTIAWHREGTVII